MEIFQFEALQMQKKQQLHAITIFTYSLLLKKTCSTSKQLGIFFRLLMFVWKQPKGMWYSSPPRNWLSHEADAAVPWQTGQSLFGNHGAAETRVVKGP